jgi:hypothetical protein
MHTLLFIIYSLLCGYGIWKIPFFRRSGIRPTGLLLLFALHVLSGCIHNMIAWHFYPGHGDIWSVFERSFLTRHRLVSEFNLFLFENSKWTYLSHNSIIFIHLILNFFSFDDLYINTLLFSFPVFLGTTALYRVFHRRFPADPLTAITVFLLPSTLFWVSCIHREAVLYMLLGFLLYWLDQLFAPQAPPPSGAPSRPSSGVHLRAPKPSAEAPEAHRPKRRTILYAAAAFLMIAYFRSAVALTLIPALLAWRLAERPPSRRQFLVLAASVLAIAFALAIPGLSFLTAQQNSFLILEAHSRLPLPALDGSWASLWRVLPAAFRNGLFEPLPGSGGQPIYLAFSIELLLIWGIIVLAGIRRLLLQNRPSPETPPHLSPKPSAEASPFSLCCLIFALASLLLIGTLVPFAGAIVRYRSIYLPFLLAPFLHFLRSIPPFRQLNALLTRCLS